MPAENRIKVKICGLSTPETLDASITYGADLVGLVFYPKSPRNVSAMLGEALASTARGRADVVALTVDASDELLGLIAKKVQPDYFQLHGTETPDRVRQITATFGIPAIKAIKVATAADVAQGAPFEDAAAWLLYDAKAPETLKDALPGGNGLPFDWSLLAKARHGFMLSGGLTPANVTEAIRVTGAPMVDVSSGVESAPGIKDIAAIRKFIETAKTAR